MPVEKRTTTAGRDEALRFTFGSMEARLARMHDIAHDKRTQFQARLRNFQRLRAHPIPFGVKAGRGKTVFYAPGQVVELALALELTQLGLLPERVEEVFRANKFPIFMAVRMAAQTLLEKGGFRPDSERSDENMPTNTGHWWRTGNEEDDPLSMFLYFDPSTLDSLSSYAQDEDAASSTFFYGGAGVVKENIVRWTAGPHVRRLSLINVTAMLWSLIQRSKPDARRLFLEETIEWSDALEERYFAETAMENFEDALVITSYEDVVTHAEAIRSIKSIPPMVAESIIRLAQRMISERRGDAAPELPPELTPKQGGKGRTRSQEVWPPERVERLKELWAQGLSAKQITEELGAVSRNAILSKAKRLGLASREEETDGDRN